MTVKNFLIIPHTTIDIKSVVMKIKSKSATYPIISHYSNSLSNSK